VDGGFLADYTNFYATVFARFDRFCRRVHFFSSDFDDAEFSKYLLRDASSVEMETFVGSYLGFIVARPLPQAIIGRTVVKTFPKFEGEDERRFCTVVDTKVNLFGLHLVVPESLPFQQQDSVVAACATVALWSAFFRTAHMFGTSAVRPAAITKAATSVVFQERALPSTGLTLEQMCEAVRANGLEPEVFTLENGKVPVLSWIRAYLERGIPLILGLKTPRGLHAVTVVGYRLSKSVQLSRELASAYHEAPSIARRIEKLYCHDDNVGPFAKFGVIADPGGGNVRLTSTDYGTEEAPAELALDSVVVPVYEKIRLGFPAVQTWVTVLDKAVMPILREDLRETREWDVSLTTTDDFKDSVQSAPISTAAKLALLVESQPRFMWQMALSTKDGEAFRLYADATAFERSFPFRRAMLIDRELARSATSTLAAMAEKEESSEAVFLRSFLLRELERNPPEPGPAGAPEAEVPPVQTPPGAAA
jgi:hypothetical protein